MKKLKYIIFISAAIVIIFLFIFGNYVSNLKQPKKNIEYLLKDSSGVFYQIEIFKDHRDDMCFSIDGSEKIFTTAKPEQVVKILSNEKQAVYWICLSNQYQLLLFYDDPYYHTFYLSDQEKKYAVGMSEDCYLMLNTIHSQELLDDFPETKDHSESWNDYLSKLLQNSSTFEQ